MKHLDATYNPHEYELKWSKEWQEKGYFHAEANSDRPAYTIIIPPPNVTAQLHMGHGLNNTIQDILIRWKRMLGFNACWLPGTDHAGISTQMMVEKSLAREGKSKHDVGREAFLKLLWDWKEKHGGMIQNQLKRLGCSCDWEREAFTMDPQLSKAVRHIFVSLYKDGLIYRGERLVNWDPALKTALSDDEVENKEIPGQLYYFRYPVDGLDEEIPIATTRPETMLGDTAVAVHPDDERFRHLIGKDVRLPLVDRLIPIIADDYVKSEFGTGAVKITPAHDPNDFEIGKRHSLPFVVVMDENAAMCGDIPEEFRGLDRFVARKAIVKALKEQGLCDKIESYKHTVPHSERSKEIIEPRLSLQWYVKMRPLVGEAIEAAKTKELRFHPEAWEKTYLHWLENIQDWCISRQLWWGHRIPIWYCRNCQGITCEMTDPDVCSHCQSQDIYQDEDVLDTWFSSWLWPLSPFGWPEETGDLKTFYPSNVLVTAPEIIYLWVARMVIAGFYTRKQLPFRDVYFNSTICDKQGRKFSKTLGNGIDPLEVIDKHGADAVRFTAVALAPLGGRVRMDYSDFEHGAKFINKLWNAARFVLKFVEDGTVLKPINELKLDLASAWLLEEFAEAADQVNRDLETYRLNDAVDRMYHFIWGSFCDWGVEASKEALAGNDSAQKEQVLSVVVYVLEGALRLASPVIPFVTEEIWQKLPHHPDWSRPDHLMVAQYPKAEHLPRYPEEAKRWRKVQELIAGVRSVRSQSGLPPKEKLDLDIRCEPELEALFKENTHVVQALAHIGQVRVGSPGEERPKHSLVHVGKGFEAFIPAAGLIDLASERQRLTKEQQRVAKIVQGMRAKLSNKSFVDRAPEEVIQETREKLASMEELLGSLEANVQSLAD